jgi:two-component system response regulator FixJ
MDAVVMNEPTVHVIDDDAAIRHSLSVLLKTAGFGGRFFATAEAFLASLKDKRPICALVDVCLPGMSGLELQQQLADRAIESVLVVMTGQANVPIAVEAMRLGALHFIEKPLDPEVLLETVNEALARQSELAEQRAKRDEVQTCLQRLTPREREVFALLVEGHLNKVIAGRLGISTRTAEHHRSHIMTKLSARSLSDLVRMSLADPDTPAPAHR